MPTPTSGSRTLESRTATAAARSHRPGCGSPTMPWGWCNEPVDREWVPAPGGATDHARWGPDADYIATATLGTLIFCTRQDQVKLGRKSLPAGVVVQRGVE